MNKLLPFALALVLAVPALAVEEKAESPAAKPSEEEVHPMSSVWPAYIAVSQWPRSADVMGLRITIPYSDSQENVTGLDVGLWGKSIYFEGIQVNILRNDVLDGCSGVQVGIYNSAGSGEMLGVQAGLWNEANTFGGVQAGLINTVGEGRGLQVGVINRAETFYGYQVGIVNIIRDAEYKFFPILNIGF